MDIWAEIGKDGIYDIRRELLESDHIWPLWLVCSMMRICGRRAGFWGRIFSFRQHVQPRWTRMRPWRVWCWAARRVSEQCCGYHTRWGVQSCPWLKGSRPAKSTSCPFRWLEWSMIQLASCGLGNCCPNSLLNASCRRRIWEMRPSPAQPAWFPKTDSWSDEHPDSSTRLPNNILRPISSCQSLTNRELECYYPTRLHLRVQQPECAHMQRICQDPCSSASGTAFSRSSTRRFRSLVIPSNSMATSNRIRKANYKESNPDACQSAVNTELRVCTVIPKGPSHVQLWPPPLSLPSLNTACGSKNYPVAHSTVSPSAKPSLLDWRATSIAPSTSLMPEPTLLHPVAGTSCRSLLGTSSSSQMSLKGKTRGHWPKVVLSNAQLEEFDDIIQQAADEDLGTWIGEQVLHETWNLCWRREPSSVPCQGPENGKEQLSEKGQLVAKHSTLNTSTHRTFIPLNFFLSCTWSLGNTKELCHCILWNRTQK